MMVLDTNVVSELMKSDPDEHVVDWIRANRGDNRYTTAVTLAEIGYGMERLPAGQRKERLRVAAGEIFDAFERQILPFDHAAANLYPGIVATRDQSGQPIDGFDAQIAAICRAHGAALVTRNIKDFRDTGIDVIDPWAGA